MIGFIPFPKILVICEMQTVSSRIRNRVTVSSSCDSNHYTTNTSFGENMGRLYCVILASYEDRPVYSKKQYTMLWLLSRPSEKLLSLVKWLISNYLSHLSTLYYEIRTWYVVWWINRYKWFIEHALAMK